MSSVPIRSNQDYYNNLGDNVQLKERAGFNTSITDVWGVALAYHFGPGGTTGDNFYNQSTTQHNTPVQWGDIRNVSNFEGYGMPFPVRRLKLRVPEPPPRGMKPMLRLTIRSSGA